MPRAGERQCQRCRLREKDFFAFASRGTVPRSVPPAGGKGFPGSFVSSYFESAVTSVASSSQRFQDPKTRHANDPPALAQGGDWRRPPFAATFRRGAAPRARGRARPERLEPRAPVGPPATPQPQPHLVWPDGGEAADEWGDPGYGRDCGAAQLLPEPVPDALHSG